MAKLILVMMTLVLVGCGSPEGQTIAAVVDGQAIAYPTPPTHAPVVTPAPYVPTDTVATFQSDAAYPAFRYDLEEGFQAIERKASSVGSGATYKALARFVVELAKEDSRFYEFRKAEGIAYMGLTGSSLASIQAYVLQVEAGNL